MYRVLTIMSDFFYDTGISFNTGAINLVSSDRSLMIATGSDQCLGSFSASTWLGNRKDIRSVKSTCTIYNTYLKHSVPEPLERRSEFS